MQNINIKIINERLIIEIDLTDPGRPSKSIKHENTVIGGTEGTITLFNPDGSPRPERLNCNVWRRTISPRLLTERMLTDRLLEAPD